VRRGAAVLGLRCSKRRNPTRRPADLDETLAWRDELVLGASEHLLGGLRRDRTRLVFQILTLSRYGGDLGRRGVDFALLIQSAVKGNHTASMTAAVTMESGSIQRLCVLVVTL